MAVNPLGAAVRRWGVRKGLVAAGAGIATASATKPISHLPVHRMVMLRFFADGSSRQGLERC
jgi:hypothetical protein